MEIKATKLTGVDLLRRCAEFTTGHDCKMSLAKAYATGHSIIRSQLFFVEMRGIPLFVASQLVRSHVGVQFFQRSRRTDRGGEDLREVVKGLRDHIGDALDNDWQADYRIEDFDEELNHIANDFDRLAPTDLCFIANAEALISMAHKRLCRKASPETTGVVRLMVKEVEKCDPALVPHLVPQCVYRGGICPEPRGCGYASSSGGMEALDAYRSLFGRAEI